MQENVTNYLQTTFCPAFEKSQIVHDKELAYVLPLDAGEGGHEVTLALSYKYDSYELLMGIWSRMPERLCDPLLSTLGKMSLHT